MLKKLLHKVKRTCREATFEGVVRCWSLWRGMVGLGVAGQQLLSLEFGAHVFSLLSKFFMEEMVHSGGLALTVSSPATAAPH